MAGEISVIIPDDFDEEAVETEEDYHAKSISSHTKSLLEKSLAVVETPDGKILAHTLGGKTLIDDVSAIAYRAVISDKNIKSALIETLNNAVSMERIKTIRESFERAANENSEDVEKITADFRTAAEIAIGIIEKNNF